ncbi:adenosylcobinamide-GDP ribazoletransferase [Micromonospora sp. NBC_01813]|uniref:adenosylcobinamide-GDP ribazoletransferase n=1 Tax=Micromonospora sp. NBC_01813 TaxID=2975988 RepID=UPI002DD9B86C|nr:adenosylcobinamide-GDP ribazoletransferase [Micromonospora sp. NBC_01813]WSA09540.1 adenosylcobinamide-GDP ribazoletransferase [Micromonospora sp. NBC_01813]
MTDAGQAGPGLRLAAGIRLAVTTFTVLPMRPGRVDRQVAAVAMALAPVVGTVFGGCLAVALLALSYAGTPALVAAAVVTGLAAALTRGLHLDGLADTIDALGSHRDAAGALEIMRRPDIGPFGVVALVVALLVQTAAVAAVAADRPWPAVLATVAAAAGAGRLAVTWACRRGVAAARPDGLGALVAGTQGRLATLTGTVLVAAVAAAAVPGRPWQGPLVVLVAALVWLGLLRHLVRRFGGVTGDVLGCGVEVATTLTYLGLVTGG